MIKWNPYIFWFLIISILIYFLPDKDELLIGVCIFAILVVLFEEISKGVRTVCEETITEIKIQIHKFRYLKRRVLEKNIEVIDHCTKLLTKGITLLEQYKDQYLANEIPSDLMKKSKVVIQERLHQNLETLKNRSQKAQDYLEQQVKVKFIGELKRLLNRKHD